MTVQDLADAPAAANATAPDAPSGDGTLWRLASTLPTVGCPECDPVIPDDDSPAVQGVPGGWREVAASLRFGVLALVERALRAGHVLRPWTVHGGMYVGVGLPTVPPREMQDLDGMAVRGRADCPHDDFADQPPVAAWDQRGRLTVMCDPFGLDESSFAIGVDVRWGGLGTLSLVDDTSPVGGCRDTHNVLCVGTWAPGAHDEASLHALEGTLRAGVRAQSLAELHALAVASQTSQRLLLGA